MDLTPKQQTSEAIRQAETILILTGQHPSVDQVSAVIGLTAILRKFGKTATAVMSDNPPASTQALDVSGIERGLGGLRDFVLKLDVTKVEVDKLRYEAQDGKLNIYLTPFKGSFAPSDVTFEYGESNINYDLAIVLGVPTRARIDRLYEQNSAAFENIPVVNLDFHRSNENYGAVNLIEPNASSLCEMLVALSESLQSGIIDGEIATALLMGIVASTDRFTAAHTSPKSLTVAAQMMAAGARQQTVVKALYRDGKAESKGSERQGGGDRGERGGGDRSSERGDRNIRKDERPERKTEPTGERSERGNAERTAQNRPVSAQPQAIAQQLPQARPQAKQSEPRPPQAELEPQSAVQRAPQPEPRTEPKAQALPALAVASASDDRVPAASESNYDDLPIIQPGHIELSEPEPIPRNPEPTSQMPQTERPQGMPVADFAVAAEMFNRQTVASESPREREAS